MTTQSGFVELNGAWFYYELAGTGEPVVFVHGFALDTRMWDDQFEVFAERYRVLRYDVCGFGRSSLPTEPYSQVDELLALLNHFQLAPAHVIGLSMGGGITLDFALVHPHAVRSLILVDAVLGGFAWSKDWGMPANLARTVGLQGAKHAWLTDEMFAPANEQPAVAVRLATMVADYSGYHWLNHDPGRWADLPANRPLEQLNVPTLVLVGERDLPDFQRVAETITARALNARHVILPGVGHMSNMEAPKRFNEIVLNFLSDLG
jgi:pimeloyl-ACP methyl ester carboxylesterase